MPSRFSTDYRNLRPYVLEDVRATVQAAIVGGLSAKYGAGALTAHRLDDTTVHIGTLSADQFPRGLLRDGSRSLAGNLPVDTGVTIDGVDISAHAADPDAHHARAHVLATAAGLGADHSMSGAAAGQVLRANSATNAMWAYLSHNDLSGVTADQHHAKQHDIVDAANHTVAGAAWSVVGATALNTLGLMLARSDATGTPKETLLKSDASGYLTLVRLIASDRLRASLVDTPTGQHLTVQPDADLLLNPGSALVKAQPGVALQASNYASQVTGWRITHQGEADFRYMFVDEMHAKSFIADLEQALAGGQIVSKSVSMLAAQFVAPGGAAGSITFRAKATAQTSTNTLVCNKPTGTVSGDVMIAHVINWRSLSVSAAPSGWTLLTTQQGGSYSDLRVYYKAAGGSEPSTYTWTFSGSDDIMVEIQSWTNVDTSNPIDVYAGAGSASNGTSITAPSISPTVGNTRLLFLAAFNDSNNTNGTATPPSGYTEQTDALGAQYTWLYSANKTQTAAGATGTVTATLAAAHQWAVVHLALRPSSIASAALTVRDLPSAPGMAVFQAGDIVRVRQFSRSAGSLSIADCWGAVSGYVDNGDKTQTWTFTRSGSPNAGSMAAGTTIQPDAIVLDYGTDGNGYYEVNAIDGANAVNSPYLQFVRWTGHPATGQAVRTRLGQLRGIFGQDEFGLFAGTGTANTDRYVRVSDYAAGNGINNLPFSLRNGGTEVVRLGGWNDVWVGPSSADRRIDWNGTTLRLKGNLSIANSSDADVITLDNAGNSYFAGVMTIGTGGEIRQGTGTLGSNYTGLRIWRDTNVGRIGGYNNNVLQWYAGTNGYLYAGGGAAAITRYGYMVQDTPDNPSFAWPFLWGGLHAVNDITTPGTGWKSSLMFGEPTLVYSGGQRWRSWLFQFAGDLNNPPADSEGSSAYYALVVQDTAGHTWPVWHAGNDGAGSGLDAGMLAGLGLSYAGNRWGVIPYVDGAAFMDIGGYIDFHAADGDGAGVRNLRLDGGMTYTSGLGITNLYGYVAVGPNNSSYSHFLTDRPAYYFNKSVVIDGTLSAYNQDLDLRRNGTQRIIGYSWGTYVTAHLTLEDVLGIVNVQASKPATPASGCKIYLRDQGGGDGVQLYMQRTNGNETRLS